MTLCERARICRYCALITFYLWWKRVLNVAILSAGFFCRGPLYLSALVRQCCLLCLLRGSDPHRATFIPSRLPAVRNAIGPPPRSPLAMKHMDLRASAACRALQRHFLLFLLLVLLHISYANLTKETTSVPGIKLSSVLFKCVNNLRKWILQTFYFIHMRL